MAKRIIWSAQAVAVRVSVLDYWYQRLGNKKYSFKLDKSLRELIKKLALHSPMGRKLKNREERFFVKDYYMIFCIDTEKTIEILQIWDTRRNPDVLSFDL